MEKYRQIHYIFHVSYLFSHVGPVPGRLPSPLPLDDNAAGECEVKDILDSRLGCYGTEYLIKYLGYPIFEIIWEPAEHLAYALDILQ